MDLDRGWHTMAQKLAVVDYWWEQQRAVCCLCEDPGCLMDPYRRQHDRNPLAATLEHLIPKREGGPNTARNVRLAHKMCNNALGKLWDINRRRELDGLEPLPIKQALEETRVRNFDAIRYRDIARAAATPVPQIHPSTIAVALSERAAPAGYFGTRVRKPAPSSLAAAVASGRPLGLERGATLPGYVAPDDGPIPRLAPKPRDLLERKQPIKKVRRPVCSACGSAEVTRDASLRWDLKAGWVIAEHHDGFDCQRCQAAASVRWEFLNQPGA